MKRKILYFLLAILVVIQFIHPAKNQSSEMLVSDITKVTDVPDDVYQILKTSCYDCHSNNTIYPWYNNIQPVAWWLNNHINEGKSKLNFSSFGEYSAEKAAKKLKGIAKEVQEDEMPLSSFTLIHRDAKLDYLKKGLIIKWAKQAVIRKPA